ncbi:MAG: 50S ribosomal protein L22 [Bacteroidetes bacterium]|jgi:large subunit ribosomal protein L22|nr:50S ribosomal protein L22 [Bacteroidota bacterium]
MEARAVCKNVRSSPRKMRLVVDQIRGKKVEEALNLLHFNPKHGSKVVEKVLRSAISNFVNKSEGSRVQTEGLVVITAFVDAGPVVKRVQPAPMGRAYRKRKRSNHVTVIVSDIN